MMKRCLRCLHLFEAKESVNFPMEELADIFLSGTERADPEDICSECKEELGMATLLGLSELLRQLVKECDS